MREADEVKISRLTASLTAEPQLNSSPSAHLHIVSAERTEMSLKQILVLLGPETRSAVTTIHQTCCGSEGEGARCYQVVAGA